MQPAVCMRGIVKRLGSSKVLDGLDLTVEVAEKLALIGPSGSGKSTVLRLIMGLTEPDAGALTLFGSGDLKAMRRGVGMVFQQFNLFPHMTVLRNVTLAPIHVLELSEQRATERAVELLTRVGMQHKLDAYPAQLSGGQKQRVAIARALALEPRLMLFDEVTSALDPELVEEVTNVIRDLARRRDMTMILVTHQLQVAEHIADRVVFMDGGRVVEEGPAHSILRAPREERTRAFVGRLGWQTSHEEP